ncbi:MAG: hypothetical protein NXI02_10255 [Rhodobacteraceae bacterium]|nr:hypothetical protein [Paracoccaceae bacterium]
MSDQICCTQDVAARKRESNFSLDKLIQTLVGSLRTNKRRRVNLTDLPPELMKDIGFEVPPRGDKSLEQHWLTELDRLSR